MYTLPEWTKYCEQDLDRFSIIELPITHSAFKRAVPGNKKHCTIANSLADYTGMDSNTNQIEVDVKYLKFVLNNKRYLLVQEVVGAEHIKQLDSLALSENGDVKFTPFILKLRFHEERAIHERHPRPTLVVQETKQDGKSVKAVGAPQEIKQSKSTSPVQPATPEPRALRKTAGVKKSRWAR
jgi:hypothetical protein